MLTLLMLQTGAQAQDLQRVDITAPGAQALRRDDTAGRIVVGRADLEQYGDTTLGAVLKRQPGVTVSGGEVRMRGLGAGYTQLLVNGEPAPPGMNIDSIAPDLVERIEILRSASAEYSAQGMAGTINIVLRKGARTRRDLKLALEDLQGRASPSASLQAGGKRGALSYSLSGALSDTGYRETPITVERSGAALRSTAQDNRGRTKKLSLAPRLNWTLDNGDTLAWQSLLDLYRSQSHGAARESALAGAGTAYPHNDYGITADTAFARSNLAWTRKLDPDAQLTARLGGDYNHRRSDYVFHGASLEEQPLFTRRVASTAADDSLTSSGKYLARIGAGHSVALGWDGAETRRRELRRQDDSTPSGAASPLVQEYQGRVRRLALYVQDEWEVDTRLQLSLGLRWEGLDTRTGGPAMAAMRRRAGVWSPVAQLLWKLDGRDQLRLALSRTYKEPPTRDLLPRRYTVNNGNSPVYPDQQGNPALRPELAWGLDAAYESYAGKDGVLSLSGYARRVRDVTVQRLFQDGAAWVSTSYNGGNASVAGLEFDARLALRQLFAHAADMELRANAARNWSRLDAAPGPDNRLAGQVPLSANLGLDWRAARRWTVGVNAGLQTGGTVRISAALRSYTGVTRTLDAHASYAWDGGMRLRFSLLNTLHQDQLQGRDYDYGGASLQSLTTTTSRIGLRLVLETPL
ncbi:TonB-dependent receptor plug domain-containing protein [Oxalobacteraceae bacterium A2-2]